MKETRILSVVIFIVSSIYCNGKPYFVEDDKIKLNGLETACPVIVSRADWGARPPRARLNMSTPVPYVILHHTYMAECFSYDACCKMMKKIQDYHMDNRGWDDIAYSFLVGEDGLVYEARGWSTVGAHAPWYNFRSIGISIMGNYTAKLPNKSAVEAVNSIINCAIKDKRLDPDYTLLGHRQATQDRTCPGEALFKEIQSWPHWKNGNHFPPRTQFYNGRDHGD